MRARSAIKVGAVVGALVIGGCLSASAAVAAAPGSCANTHWCVYHDDNYGGVQLSGQDDDPGGWGSMNDQASSLGNNKNNLVRFYKDSSYGGWNVCVSNNSGDANLPSDRNDEITSVKIGNQAYC